ncbi:MAG TPA: hypothetical protein VFY17_08640 [Pilimelia sp.]|nr:hypothetical protein [Pilimelia sp.]
MSTDDSTPERGQPRRPGRRRATRWLVPGTAVAGGVAYLAAGLRAGDPAFAFGGLAVMLATAAAFVLLARRSELVAGLLDRRDERINAIDRDASTFAGMTLVCAVLAAFVWEIAHGRDGQPFAALGALGAVAYVAALAVLRLRR